MHLFPLKFVTCDEQLLTFRGRCPFKQYIPSKPGKYGIKLWMLSDSQTSYVCRLQVYIGRQGDTRETNQSKHVVTDLCRSLKGTGKYVTCDNFFTSMNPKLARSWYVKELIQLNQRIVLSPAHQRSVPVVCSAQDPKARKLTSGVHSAEAQHAKFTQSLCACLVLQNELVCVTVWDVVIA